MVIKKSMLSVIDKIFHVFLDDLKKGIKEEEAGWRSLDDFGITSADKSEFLKSGIIEMNPIAEIRFNFRNKEIRKILKKYGLSESCIKELDYLDYLLKNREIIESDIRRLSDAKNILNQISKILQSSSKNWIYITALGLWKMFESSGMPAPIDDVLREGFSPRDWTIKAVSSSYRLALDTAKRFGEISNFNEVINFLEKMGISNVEDIYLPSSDQEDFQRVKKVIRWNDIEDALTEPTIKIMAFLWFSFFILDLADLVPASDEVSHDLLDAIRSISEDLLGRNYKELLNELEKMIDKLTEQGITWAADILHVPEVI